MRRFRLLFVAPTLLLLAFSVGPLISGDRTLFLRDVFNTHLEMKWAQAEAMKEGSIPLVDDLRSGGQAHVGNPNTVPLYPDNLLYLVLPFFWVFNAHFWIHLLLAPFAMYWLGREWGLRREAAWAAGVLYATCGYTLSNYNFYNLVAGVTLAPALAAALLRTTKEEGRRWGFVATAVLWCLLLLAGDPIVAVLAVVLGGLSMLGLAESRGRWKSALGAGLIGSAMAAPQLVEFLRVLPLTFRGFWGYSAESALTASWNPRTVLDWVLPLPYGEPSFDFWGLHLFADQPPLYYTFYPGVVAVVLFLWSGRPASRAAWLAWGWLGAGLFFALGAHNPPLAWLLETTGFQLVRFPVKFWLWVAIGGALLCGVGVERWLASREEGSSDGLFVVSSALAGLAAWAGVFWLRSEGSRAALRSWIPEHFDAAFVDAERIRWAGLALISAALLTAVAGLVWLAVRRGGRSGTVAAILALHTVCQLILLSPLLPTDEVDRYRTRHETIAALPEGSRVVHGHAGSLFGRASIDPSRYPDRSFVWLQRQTFSELYPTAGTLQGLRYELQLSPEGLDSFRTRAAAQAIQNLPDPERIRLLEAWGVEYLILGRDLELSADPRLESGVERVATFRNDLGDPLTLYRLSNAIPSARFVGRVLPQAALTDELRTLAGATHEPRGAVIVAAGAEQVVAPPGTLEITEDSREAFRGTVRSSGGGAVVLQRTNLPILEATVSGETVEIVDADLHRLAIPVPPGEHEVTLEVDRGPWRIAWLVALLALLELGLVFRRMGRSGLDSGPAERSAA